MPSIKVVGKYSGMSGIEHLCLLTSVGLSNYPVSSFARKECVKIVLIKSPSPHTSHLWRLGRMVIWHVTREYPLSTKLSLRSFSRQLDDTGDGKMPRDYFPESCILVERNLLSPVTIMETLCVSLPHSSVKAVRCQTI